MKTVLLLGGPAAGQRVEVQFVGNRMQHHDTEYHVVPMCSHGEVHWFGVLDGADPLALLIAGYAPAKLTGETVLAAYRIADESIYGHLPLSTGLVDFIVDLVGNKVKSGGYERPTAPVGPTNREAIETAIIERWEQHRPKYGDRPLTNGIVNFMLDFMGTRTPPGLSGDPTAFMFGGHK